MWESIKSLFSPKTIPFLISQGVVPKLLPVGTLVLGMILAFLWAYAISPTVYTSAEAIHLGPSWKEEWVKQTAWQVQASGNESIAQSSLSYLGDADKVVANILANPNLDPQTRSAVERLVPYAQPNEAQLAKVTPSALNSNLTPVLCVLVPGLLLTLAVVVNTIIPITLLFQRRADPSTSTVTAGQEAARRKALDAAKAEAAKVSATPTPATVDRGTPVSKFMSTYVIGDDLYDDSFSIETASNEFLGETGAAISKTIGVGDPDKVTAVEVWVFDKTDIRTVTKVIMSEHAFKDEALRAELAPKGEAVLATPGGFTLLETTTLTIQARFVDMAYGSGSLPTNSFFDRLSIEITAWPKKAPAGDPLSETGPVARQ